jgi:hypothetical protein
MTPAKAFAVAMGFGVAMGATPALAGQQVYVYSVVHPLYGEIGTLRDTVSAAPRCRGSTLICALRWTYLAPSFIAMIPKQPRSCTMVG